VETNKGVGTWETRKQSVYGRRKKKGQVAGYPPRGVLPYLAYTGMCRWTGYGFWPLCPKEGI